MEIYNRLSSDIWAMNIPLAAKVIAERICALTKNGEKECFISNSYLVNLLRLSESTVQRALNLLQDENIISIKVTTKSDKKVRLVHFLYQENDLQKDKKQPKNNDTEKISNTSILNVPNCQNASMQTVILNTPNYQNKSLQTVKMQVSSIQSNDQGVRRESNDLKTTHSPSSFSDVFSVQKAEEILSKTSDELKVSLSETKLHSEAVKFFDYYSEKNLSIGQLKVKARTWIDNCKKYPDFKNKKTYDTAAKEGLIGVLREECEKEMIEQEKGFKPKEQNSNPLLVTDFYDAMKKEGYSNSIFEYPIK